MYEFVVANTKTEKRLRLYISIRNDVKDKLDRLKIDPRRSSGAHPLHGTLFGKWACWLGSNIRMIYLIDDSLRTITILAVGNHKIYW